MTDNALIMLGAGVLFGIGAYCGFYLTRLLLTGAEKLGGCMGDGWLARLRGRK